MTSDLTLTRRGFVKAGGALFVGIAVAPELTLGAAQGNGTRPTTLDATQPASWLAIHEDGSIVARTRQDRDRHERERVYIQAIAEELDVDPARITLVMGHTDETPDGGYSAALLMGATNQKKVAAYTRQALLGLASARLGVPAANLTVSKGVVSGGGKSVSYAELVKGQQLDLKIPVSGTLGKVDPKDHTGIGSRGGLTVIGNPPMKKIEDYTVVGQSFPRPGIRDIVMGKPVYSGDVVVPGMMHARMVRPAALGATLVSAGRLDRAKFPTAEVVKQGNLVAVVSPNEWEALAGAQAVASDTKWTTWSGLPGSDNVFTSLHSVEWTPAGKRGDAAKVDAGLAGAAKVISASYEQPYVRHAPMGAFVALADVRADGTVVIHAQHSQAQGARSNIASTLGVPVENVTIRWAQGPGQYGRTTNGGDGAIADAAIVSKLIGKPVRVTWTLPEDLAWSTVSPAWYADVKVGLDAQGNLVGYKSDWYSSHQNEARMLGAILAGLPTPAPAVTSSYGVVSTVWPYEKVPAFEQAFGCPNVANEANGGLRGNIMRTPWQRQQNLALECAITEAAAAAGADQIEFRQRHTTNAAFAGVLKAVAETHGYAARRGPNPRASRSGSTPIAGRGVGVAIRSGAPWVAIADVEVTPATGVVKLTALTVGVDVGKVMNPRHLTSMLQGGAVMGVGEALFEEVTFDTGRVTSTDWTKYRIPRMADVPIVNTVFTSRNDRGINGGGEGANAAPMPAIAAAVFDATGVMPRRVPLTPAYVKSLLNA